MSSPEGFKLFVGSLPTDCNQDELNTVFSNYGQVAHIHVMNPHPRSGQRCAFVFYVRKESGDDAVKVLDNKYKIRVDAEHPIVVRWSKDSGFDSDGKGDGKGGCGGDWDDGRPRRGEPPPDSHKLFVGGLPSDITEEELRIVFGTYGEVTHCHIMNAHPRTGLRCAFMYYSFPKSAEDAIEVLDTIYKIRDDAEAPIQVRWANKDGADKKGLGKGEYWGGGKGDSWVGSGSNVDGKGVDAWGDSKGGFKGDSWTGGGKGKDAKGKGWSSSLVEERGGWGEKGGAWQDKGCGWSDWGGKGGHEKNNTGWSGGGKGGRDWQDGGKGSWKGDDSWGEGGADPWGSQGWGSGKDGGKDGGKHGKGKGKDDAGGGGWKGGDPSPLPDLSGTRLYVANLPEDIQEHAVEYVFSTYGKVQKVHLMTGKVKHGCISAFVEFVLADEASIAISALDNKYEIRAGYGPIVVKLANAKGSGRGIPF
mmetsp:Transcript_83942/g.151459  ORF Transcript_83942/g.151459 Transcript_83942/m.151459 type:complete len:475 (+) Transcript_83942:90-1514(+)